VGEFCARDQLGDIAKAEGRLPDALREFRAFQQIVKRLIESDPENVNWQRELSVSHNKIGGVLQAQGQRPSRSRNIKPPRRSCSN